MVYIKMSDMEDYDNIKAVVRSYHRMRRKASPLIECECGSVVKAYTIRSHLKTARHARLLERRKQKQAENEDAADVSDNSSNSQGGNTEEAKI